MNPTTREYIYFALGLLGAVWFFVGYPSQDPRSLIDVSHVERTTIERKAVEKLEAMGYNSTNFRLSTRFYSNRILLDSLQSQMGRDNLVAQLRERNAPNLVLFYWEVSFTSLSDKEKEIVIRTGEQASEGEDYRQKDFSMHFDQSGNFLELVNPEEILPPYIVNREAIAVTFGEVKDSAETLLSVYSDTAISGTLLIDLQRNWEKTEQRNGRQVNQLKEALEGQNPFRLSGQDVFDMASYYLRETGWSFADLAQDTVYMGRVNGKNTVTARFKSTNSEPPQDLTLNVRLTSTGGLMDINSAYNVGVEGAEEGSGLWSVLEDALVLLFILGGIILFFFRIRARAIDTKPALVISILTGLAISSVVVLYLAPQTDFFTNADGWTQVIELLVASGLSGAGGSLAFFIFFAIGDSITRQHWPQKLTIYDYLRQGMVFNKPVGFMLVRSVTLAFILAGIWTLMLWLWPHLYIDIHNEIFVTEKTAWPPLYLLLSNGIYSLSVILGIFLVLGGQTFAQTKNKVIASLLMVFACGIIVPYSDYLGPSFYQFVAGLLLGVALLYIYLEWDFLTLLLSHFLFLGLMSTTTGWIVDGSLDYYLFVGTAILMAMLLVGGLVAIGRGKEEKVLSQYVPQYVEELAQEERIKQELEIAREVQQSFLPLRMPQFEDLELAAICEPAYETGGDYYDFVPLDEHRIAVAIGDVSGKGIQAAFFMTFVKGILHSLCREIDSPAEVLKKTNRLFCENAPKGTFISLVYGIVDLEKGVFHFARAGHNPVLRLSSDNGSVKELQPKGIGIGLAGSDSFDQNIEEVKLDITGNDILVLYTDGIVEALNENKKFYGEHRLRNLLLKNKKQSAAVILREVSQDVRYYIGDAKQHDDMTMLIMKLKKRNND